MTDSGILTKEMFDKLVAEIHKLDVARIHPMLPFLYDSYPLRWEEFSIIEEFATREKQSSGFFMINFD